MLGPRRLPEVGRSIGTGILGPGPTWYVAVLVGRARRPGAVVALGRDEQPAGTTTSRVGGEVVMGRIVGGAPGPDKT